MIPVWRHIVVISIKSKSPSLTDRLPLLFKKKIVKNKNKIVAVN